VADSTLTSLPTIATPDAADMLYVVESAGLPMSHKISLAQVAAVVAGDHAASHAAGGSDPITGPLALGATPAQSGALRLSSGDRITARNLGNTADVTVITFDADVLRIGDITNVAQVVTTLGNVALQVGASIPLNINQNALYPNVDGGTVLGFAGQRFLYAHLSQSLDVGNTPATTGAIRLSNNQPITARDAANTADLALLKGNAAGEAELPTRAAFTQGLTTAAPIELVETTSAVPAVNRARLWVEDNGAGKTRLMVQFATGAPIQIAIEP
jgi:hypothetical protein